MSLIRFPDLAGLGTILTGSLRGRLDAIRGAILRGEDGHRSTRSMLELVLHELQHPKQVLYEGPETTLPAGGAFVLLTPWIDANLFRVIGWYLANTGQAVVTNETYSWSEDPAGAAPFVVGNAISAAVGNGTTWYSQDHLVAITGWSNVRHAPLAARYVRFGASSVVGTTARCKVVGMR